MNAKEWLEAWTKQLQAVNRASDVRRAHQWLWNGWSKHGKTVVNELNKSLGLRGDYVFRTHYPHFVAGNIESPKILFVNINPGWSATANKREDKIVRASEHAAWQFCTNLFTTYPVQVGSMGWWSQAIGLAWRIVHGTEPRQPAAKKREWACKNVAGWELIPLHSAKLDFKKVLAASQDTGVGSALCESIHASLSAARRVQKRILVAHSKAAVLTLAPNESKTWRKCRLGKVPVYLHGNGPKKTAVLGRPFVGAHTGMNFNQLATAIRNS